MNSQNQSAVLDSLLFPKLFRSFRMAIQPSKMLMAFCAVVIICVAGWLMDFTQSVVVGPDGTTEVEAYVISPGVTRVFIAAHKETGGRTGVFAALWHLYAQRFNGAVYAIFEPNVTSVVKNIADCFKGIGWALHYHPLYCIILFVIKLAVTSLAGGGICRIAAMEFARDEKPGLTEALEFGRKRFFTFFFSVLVPVLIIVLLSLVVIVVAAIGCVIPRAGEVIIALFMPLGLFLGGVIAAVLIGAVAGFNLLFPAVAYDGCECFDAFSRACGYVYYKPWRMAFYTAVAAVYGSICYVFVRFFIFLMLLGTYGSLEIGMFGKSGGEKLARIWAKPDFVSLIGARPEATANWTEWFAAHFVHLCLLVVLGLVLSFIISFYFSANTIIYALIRNRADNTALDDVYTQVDDAKFEKYHVSSGQGSVSSPEAPEPS